jgi:hypothetical protein
MSFWLNERRRPPTFPLDLTAASPALVRSRMMSRSNSARAPKMWKMSFPPGGGGVDLLGEAAKADLPVVEPRDPVDEVPEGAAKSIQSPDDQGIPCPQMGERLLEALSFG